MKRVLLIVFTIIVLVLPTNINALNTDTVTLVKCIDGDTAKFNINNEEHTVRFLAIDTPETLHPKIKEEEYGKQASNYTCNRLKNATTITLEYDDNSDKYDKYNRVLAWVFVDEELLQSKLIEQGLGEVKYLYGDYKYTEVLKEKELEAKNNKVGIYSNTKTKKVDILDLIIKFLKDIIVEIVNILINIIVNAIKTMI